MIKTLVTNREWGTTFSLTHVASAVKACLGRTEVTKRLLFIAFAVTASFACQTANAQKVQTTAAWEGTTPSAANGKTVYLYNVGAKQFLGKGGVWGTEATMSLEGTPFKLSTSGSTFTLTSLVKLEGGNDKGMLTLADGNNAKNKYTYFVDQTGTSFTATAQGNGYELSSTVANDKSSMNGNTYKMVVFGANQKAYAKLATETLSSDSTDYATWIIVTHDQRLAAFGQVNNAHVAAVNATFLMHDFDFARNDYACEYWRTGATTTGTTTGTLSYTGNKQCKPEDAYPKTTTVYTYTSTHPCTSSGWFGSTSHTSIIETTEDHGASWKRECQEASGHTSGYTTTVTYNKTGEEKKEVAGYTYYLGNGYGEGDKVDYETGDTYTQNVNLQEPYGGAWTANIHGKRGTVVQTILATNMVKEGWYRISCVGFTTTTKGIARLFAASGKGNNGTGSDATAQTEKFATYDLHKIDAATRPATYVAASKLLDTPNVNTFDASVRVYVSATDAEKKTFESLSFGIQVGSAADATQDADDDAWTCFDNFKIMYLGTPENEIILDEDQTDGGYIKAQAWDDNKTVQKSIVYLHRTMNADKWNSLVLPINLNVGQVKSIFGDEVRISEFKGAYDENHPQRIIFDPITADRTNDDAIAIEEGKLYLVKPNSQGGMPTGQKEKKFTYDGKTISVTDYYTIIGVTFKKKSEIAEDAYSGRVMGTTGNENWQEAGAPQVQFVGTYVKCFDENNMIPVNSYVLNGNNQGGTAGLWYYRTKETKTKGFRGWLQSANDLPSKGFDYEIDGVVETVNGDVTAIDGIEAEQQHNANIYNLNGQLVRQGAASTEGLPSGLYIVGGKKVVVK